MLLHAKKVIHLLILAIVFSIRLSTPEEIVPAKTLREAFSKCEEIAQRKSQREGRIIIVINAKKSVISGYYVCIFQETSRV
jgi:hypothetical protein